MPGMKMALASAEDMEVAYDLCALIDGISRGYYPASDDDEDAPTFFDEDDRDHLRALYKRIEKIAESAGSIHRVVGGFSCALNPANELLDLTKDVVELHPRLIAALQVTESATFQARVNPWMQECFGAEIAVDGIERNHRFFEEAGELVQAGGMTRSEAHQLVDYTWSRPVGEKNQEAGGVMVTFAAWCLAHGIDMHAAGEAELGRISEPETVAKIRAKQAAKPKHSPLAEAPSELGQS